MHDSVCKGIEGFMQRHLRIHNVADNGRFPVRVEEMFTEFSCEGIKGKIISKELILIVFDPIVYFDILEGHEDIPYFVFIHDFAFVEVGVEILNELSKDIRKKGFGPRETLVALGVFRDCKDFKNKKHPRHAPEPSALSSIFPKHCQSIPEHFQSIFKAS